MEGGHQLFPRCVSNWHDAAISKMAFARGNGEGWLLCSNMLEVALELVGNEGGSLRPRSSIILRLPLSIMRATHRLPACNFYFCVLFFPQVHQFATSFVVVLFFSLFFFFFSFLRQETQLLRTFFCCSSPLMGKVNYLEPRRTLECCIFLDHRFNWIFSNFFIFSLLFRDACFYM